jgi:putative sigma-54 modulation protein
MRIQFTGHQIDNSQALRDFTSEKFTKLLRHFDKIINIDVTFEIEKIDHLAKATIQTAGKIFHANASASDHYAAVDALVDKLDRQLKDYRGKQIEHREREYHEVREEKRDDAE